MQVLLRPPGAGCVSDRKLRASEIARRLVLSLNTVRTHTKNVYAKLGVRSRAEAARIWQEPKDADTPT